MIPADAVERAMNPISMGDVRLVTGEGKLSASDVLAAVNGILASRRLSLQAALGDGVVSGWKLVPVELTDEMMDAGCEIDAYEIAMQANRKSHEELMAKYPGIIKPREHGAAACQTLPMIWKAMLDAAPAPPTADKAGQGGVDNA